MTIMRDGSAPTVSIAIPTYSRAECLAEAVQSALAQSYPSFEVLISDDGTNPEVRAVGETAAMRDSRVRYWRNEKNLGLAGNWNRCLDESRGEFVLIIGDDDRILPDGLATLVSQVEERDDVVFANHYVIDHSGCRLPVNGYCGRENLLPGIIENAELVVWRKSIPIHAALMRTALARKIRFREDLNTPELVLFAEMASARAVFRFSPAFVSEYRVHPASMTSSGLWNDLFATCLIDLDVQPETESQKRELLAPILVDGIAKYLQKGDVRAACHLRNSRYGPGIRELTPHSALMRVPVSTGNRSGNRL